MDIRIYNQDIQKIKLIDKFSYFHTETAYNAVGNFELKCPIEFFEWLKVGNYLTHSNDDKHAFVIEYVEKDVNEENAECLVVKGRTIDSIFDRRVCLGENPFYTVEPSQIMNQLLVSNVTNPTDTTRKIENIEIGNLVNSDEGGVDYLAKNSILLDDITALAQNAYIGFNSRISDEGKIVFDTYKGINRTEKENTEVSIVDNSVTSVTANSTIDSLSGWINWGGYSRYLEETVIKLISGGDYGAKQIDKTKLMDREVVEITEEGEPVWGDWYWKYSGYISQNLSLDENHIYYVMCSGWNKTTTQLGAGIILNNSQGENEFSINFPPSMSKRQHYSHLFVPKQSGVHTFVLGYGDLEEKEGQHAYFDCGLVIDLTATFGVGNEPKLAECDGAFINQGESWIYRTKVITLIPNNNPIMAFSRDRDTLLTVEYVHNAVNEKNRIYIHGSNNITEIQERDSKTGINLKETYYDPTNVSLETEGITIPEPSYRQMLKNAGKATLNSLTDAEAISGTFYLLSNKKYGVDFYLGDMVDFIDNKLGITTYKRISAIYETWDESGYSLEVGLGDDILQITNFIKLISKGVL